MDNDQQHYLREENSLPSESALEALETYRATSVPASKEVREHVRKLISRAGIDIDSAAGWKQLREGRKQLYGKETP